MSLSIHKRTEHLTTIKLQMGHGYVCMHTFSEQGKTGPRNILTKHAQLDTYAI